MNVTDHLVIEISACFASGVRSNFHGGGVGSGSYGGHLHLVCAVCDVTI